MSPERFAARAESLVGTPFRLGGRDPATGLDCVGLVAWALGPQTPAPRGYRLRNSGIAHHLAFVQAAGFAPANAPARRGDMILAVPGPAQHHLLVVLGPDRFIHAHAGLRRAVVHRGPLPWDEIALWRLQSKKD